MEREVKEVTAEWYGQKMSCQVSPQLALRSGASGSGLETNAAAT